MFEIHAPSFLGAATEIARMRQILKGVEASTERDQILVDNTISVVKPTVEVLYQEANKVGAKLACVSAERLYGRLLEEPCAVTLGALADALKDIESRFADHLGFIKVFVIPEERAILFQGADQLLSPQSATSFPSVWFDCEEAAKCLCLGRPTACVFHTMRMLEIAIASFAKRLKIPDPVKATDRNWGNMLNTINEAINKQFPKSKRLPGTEGAKLEAIYVTLDAIKNPWRNATMHVESVYTVEEAGHILTCTAHVMDKMSAIFDENGVDSPSP